MVVIALRLFNYNLMLSTILIIASGGKRGIITLLEVIIMKLENWNKNTSEVTMWLEKEDRGDVGQAIALSIMLGTNAKTDELRSTYWTAIRSIGSPYEDFPAARRGRESSMPEAIDLSAISVKNAVTAAFADISEPSLITTVILPHGRTGGAYADIQAYADSMGKKAYNALTQAYKDGRWLGEMNGLIPVMTPPATKADDGGQEEE
tara:strand:+ start:246 stop:863 length:618 start_codon:yes stop_codon:yes gene_type:complete